LDHEGIAVIRKFYEEHGQALFTYALALTRHAAGAEDAVHDAMCRLLRRARLPAELRPYVFRCVRNAAVDAWRKEKAQEKVGIFDLIDGNNDTFDRALFAQIEALVFELPRDEMEAIVLHAFNGLSFREVAGVKRVSPNTAASWYRRGLEKLRERIQVNANETDRRHSE
jgi:RNA polymerase sigma-70 factor (ECF subfamily)